MLGEEEEKQNLYVQWMSKKEEAKMVWLAWLLFPLVLQSLLVS